MRARREPAAPPLIPGYEYVRLLGLGGFADVFEYRQELPRRSVAVKVLLASSLDGTTRERFFAEANLMAQLSHHPSIVTIYHADIAADGRPYLVMENCSRPGLGGRYRSERISVEESLRTGIRLASAVEAAHRRGILHRDIKPANILTTDYGWPALTDFGIAATTSGDHAAGTGMSIPWSPPELLAEHPVGDERGDIYSLAATIYSMLAGRSPFEVAGQPNGPADLISRIERSPLSRIDREDVPPGLEAVLARAMSKDLERRYSSAIGVAQALQQIERSLGLTATSIDLSEHVIEETTPRPAAASPGRVADGENRLQPIVSIDPVQADSARGASEAEEMTRARPVTTISASGEQATPAPQNFVTPPPMPGGGVFSKVGAPQAPSPRAEVKASRQRRGGRIALIAGGAVVVAAVVTTAVLAGGATQKTAPEPTSSASTSAAPLTQAAVPAPEELSALTLPDGTVRFSWTNPDPQEGDSYLWTEVGVGVTQAPALVTDRFVDVPAHLDETPVCVEVSIVRADRRASTSPAQECSE